MGKTDPSGKSSPIWCRVLTCLTQSSHSSSQSLMQRSAGGRDEVGGRTPLSCFSRLQCHRRACELLSLIPGTHQVLGQQRLGGAERAYHRDPVSSTGRKEQRAGDSWHKAGCRALLNQSGSTLHGFSTRVSSCPCIWPLAST